MASDLRFFGADPDMLPAPPETDAEGVWPEHVPALTAFLAVSGQWRVLARQGQPDRVLGLDYAAAEAGLRLAGIAVTPDTWTELRLIEAGARDALNRD